MEKSTEIKSTQVDKALAKLQDEAEEEKEDVDSTETDEVTDDIVSTLREVATERATGLMGRRG